MPFLKCKVRALRKSWERLAFSIPALTPTSKAEKLKQKRLAAYLGSGTGTVGTDFFLLSLITLP